MLESNEIDSQQEIEQLKAELARQQDNAVEESERLSPMIPANGVPFRMATREDTRRLHEMRKKNREQKKAVAG